MKNKFKELIICSLALAVAVLTLGEVLASTQVRLRDGTIHENVTDVRDLGNVFVFRGKDGRLQTIAKNRIDRITENGRLVFESVGTSAERRRLPSGIEEFVFLRNAVEVGRGQWDERGEFRVTSGRVPDGVYRQNYDSGELEREMTFENGRLNGVLRTYFKSGRIEREGTIVNGREEGVSKLFHPNGTLKGESQYANGLRHGETKLYHESGKLKAVMNFQRGEAHGLQTMYYESGQVESEVTFRNGQKHGQVKSYHENGKLSMTGNYVNDLLEGEVVSYYESGRVRRKQNFRQGRVLR